MYAAAAPSGADDAWYDLGIDIEILHMEKVTFCGGTIDIAKIFDQVCRVVLDGAAVS